MDTSELIREPELLPYLRNDLLPGISELLHYAEGLHIAPNAIHGLITRIEAMRHDLTSALAMAGVRAGGNEGRIILFPDK